MLEREGGPGYPLPRSTFRGSNRIRTAYWLLAQLPDPGTSVASDASSCRSLTNFFSIPQEWSGDLGERQFWYDGKSVPETRRITKNGCELAFGRPFASGRVIRVA